MVKRILQIRQGNNRELGFITIMRTRKGIYNKLHDDIYIFI